MFSLESTLLTYLDMYRYVRPGHTHFRIGYGAPKNYLAMILRGHARLHCGDEVLQVQAGELLFIPQGCVYESEWFADGDDCVFYSIGFIFRAQDENIRFPLQKLPDENGFRELFDSLYLDAAERQL